MTIIEDTTGSQASEHPGPSSHAPSGLDLADSERDSGARPEVLPAPFSAVEDS